MSRATPAASSSTVHGASAAATTPAGESTVVSLGAAEAKPASPSLVWENRVRSTASTMMAQNFSGQTAAGRLKGLGSALLKAASRSNWRWTPATTASRSMRAAAPS